MSQDHHSELPPQWAHADLGSVLPLNYGKGLVELARDATGDIPVYGSSGVVGRHSTALVEGPALIVGRKGSVGEVYLSVGACWPIDTTYYARAPQGLVPEYALHLLRHLELGRLDRSTAIPGLSRDDYNGVLVPIAPTSEQTRIVAAIEQQLSDIDAGVALLERVQANLKRYRASVLKAACEGRLVPTEAELARKEKRSYEPADVLLARILKERRARWEADQLAKMKAKGQVPRDGWKAKYDEQDGLKLGGLSQLPNGWTWARAGQLADRVTVGHVGPMKERYVDSGVPFLRSQNVRENRFDPEGLLHIPTDFHEELGKSKLKPGDIAVVRSGAVGTACVIPESLPDANCADLVIIQRPRGLVPRYGAYVLNSVAQTHVQAGKVGIALTHFNTRSVADLPIPLPPIAEQLRIVTEVERLISVADEVRQTVRVQLARASRLRQSILKRAFEGKLVPQDPNDEPASVLLDRVRNGAATTPSRTRRRPAPTKSAKRAR